MGEMSSPPVRLQRYGRRHSISQWTKLNDTLNLRRKKAVEAEEIRETGTGSRLQSENPSVSVLGSRGGAVPPAHLVWLTFVVPA